MNSTSSANGLAGCVSTSGQLPSQLRATRRRPRIRLGDRKARFTRWRDSSAHPGSWVTDYTSAAGGTPIRTTRARPRRGTATFTRAGEARARHPETVARMHGMLDVPTPSSARRHPSAYKDIDRGGRPRELVDPVHTLKRYSTTRVCEDAARSRINPRRARHAQKMSEARIRRLRHTRRVQPGATVAAVDELDRVGTSTTSSCAVTAIFRPAAATRTDTAGR